MDGQIEEWMNGQMEGLMDEGMDRWMWIKHWTDGRVNGWTDRRMDEWTDGRVDG